MSGDRVSLGDMLCDENSDFVYDCERKEEKILIRQLIENLPERDKEIITLYFGFRLTQREIGDKFGVSQSYIGRLLSQILKRIKKQLNEYRIIESSCDGIIKKDKTVKELVKKKDNEEY